MPIFKQGVSFPLGESIVGTDSGRLVNSDLLGLETWIQHDDIVQGDSQQLFDEIIRKASRIMICRNETGAALLPGEIGALDLDAGPSGIAKVAAKSSAGDTGVVIVDPLLPLAGVADDDLFIGFVEGPAKVKSPDAGLDIDSARMFFAAGASGRSALATSVAGDTREILGTLLVPITTQANNEGTLLPCLLHQVGF